MTVGISETGVPVTTGREEEELETVAENVVEDVAVEVGCPVEVVTLVDGGTPVDVDVPVDSDAPGDVDAPVDADTPVDDDDPVDVDAPADSDSPVDSDTVVDSDTAVVNDTPVDVVEPRVVGNALDVNEPPTAEASELDVTLVKLPAAEEVELSSVTVDERDDVNDESWLMAVTTGLLAVVVDPRSGIVMALWRATDEVDVLVVDDGVLALVVLEVVVELGEVTAGSTLPEVVDVRLSVSEEQSDSVVSPAVVVLVTDDTAVTPTAPVVEDGRSVEVLPVPTSACLRALTASGAAGPQARERRRKGPASAAAASDRAYTINVARILMCR